MGEIKSIRVIVIQETEVDLSGVLKNGLSFEINLNNMIFLFLPGTYKTSRQKLAYLLLSYSSNYGNPVKFIKLLKGWLKKINVEINISYSMIPSLPNNNTPFIKTFISYVENNPQNFYNFIFGDDSYLQFGDWKSPTDVYPTSLLWWRNRYYKDLEDMWGEISLESSRALN